MTAAPHSLILLILGVRAWTNCPFGQKSSKQAHLWAWTFRWRFFLQLEFTFCPWNSKTHPLGPVGTKSVPFWQPAHSENCKDKESKQLALAPRRVIKRRGMRQWRRFGLNNLMRSFMDDISPPSKLLSAHCTPNTSFCWVHCMDASCFQGNHTWGGGWQAMDGLAKPYCLDNPGPWSGWTTHWCISSALTLDRVSGSEDGKGIQWGEICSSRHGGFQQK